MSHQSKRAHHGSAINLLELVVVNIFINVSCPVIKERFNQEERAFRAKSTMCLPCTWCVRLCHDQRSTTVRVGSIRKYSYSLSSVEKKSNAGVSFVMIVITLVSLIDYRQLSLEIQPFRKTCCDDAGATQHDSHRLKMDKDRRIILGFSLELLALEG